MPISSYRELKVWQAGMKLTAEVYDLAKNLPQYELYGMSSQIRRAAVSIPANIAEGHARDSTKEFLHHLSIARGSLAELETLLMLAEQMKYCQPSESAGMLNQCDQLSRMLSALRRRLKARIGEDR